MESQRAMHDAFVSAEVERELDNSGFRNREPALDLARSFPALAITAELAGLAIIRVRERVMPAPALGDALHVAVAAVHQVEDLVSWNVRHLANQNKRQHLMPI